MRDRNQRADSRSAVVLETDVLILGGSTAACAAAVAAAESGLRVLMATARTYLGEDIAAFLRLIEPPADRTTLLARRLFRGGVPTPMHIKETLERELLHAGVELLYGCHPGGAMVAPDGAIAGAAIVSRAGRHVVLARSVVDATWTAVFARQAECRFRGTGPAEVEFSWTLSAASAPPGAEPAGSVKWQVDERTSRDLPLWRHRFSAPLDLDDPASLAAVEVAARNRYFRPDQFFESDSAFYLPPRRLETGATLRGARGPGQPEFAAFSAAPGLHLLSAAVDADDQALAALLVPGTFMAVGEQLGKAIAAALPARAEGRLEWRCRGAKDVSGIRMDGRDLRGAPAEGLPVVELPARLPVLASTDVLVVGGGTAGAPAGIAVAREGRKALVVEALAGPGGLGTWGQIASYHCGYRQGFTAEVDAGVAAMGPSEMLPPKGKWRVEWKRAWWVKTLSGAGATLWPDTIACGVQVQGDRVTGVVVAGPCGMGLIQAGCVIDASGNADLVAAAGAPVLQPGVERAAVQGTGLSPREPGRDYANSDHTFSDDGDLRDVTRSFIAARRKFRERFDLAPILNTRERRRIQADVMIQVEDVFAGRTWPDALHIAKSSFDTHGFTIHPLFTALAPGRNEEQLAVVPLRALLPRGLEGVLVTGLGIGAHRDAMPVVRMQPCVQNQGYAAGLVAVAALGKGGRIRAVDFGPIQERLIGMGILEEWARKPDPFPVPDDALGKAVEAEPHSHVDLALLFAHRERALPRLRAAFGLAEGKRRERIAVVLGLMGDATGSQVIAEAISSRPWDQGWNYRGMDQFEESRSPMDSLLWAVAGAPVAEYFPAVLEKLQKMAHWQKLALHVELSHAQSIAAACAAMVRFDSKKELAPLLARILTFHQITGNHQSDWEAVFSDQPRCVNHNEARSRALRELALAVGLWQCGDHGGIGRLVLERFAKDWRGPLAHHAREVVRNS